MSGESDIVLPNEQSLPAERISKFLNLLDIKNNQKFRSAQKLIQPFKIDERGIKRVNSVASERVKSFADIEPNSFEAIVRFSNNKEDKKDNFDDFIESSTDLDEPESISLSYSYFSITDDGHPKAAIIDVVFMTERQLKGQDLGLHDVNVAYMYLSVSGSDSHWVRATFDRLLPILDNKKLGGAYRPLWIFRSKFYNSILSQVLGFMGLFIGMNIYARLSQADERLTTEAIIEKIVSEPKVSEKINIFTQEVLDPTLEPWWDPVLMMASGALCFGVIWAVSGLLLPKLCPPSIISFGSSAEKSERRLLLHKTIVFTLIGGVIVIPFLQRIIF